MIVPRKAYGLLLFVLLGLGLLLLSRIAGHSLAAVFFGPQGPVVPLTTHIVLFQFKEGTSAIAIKEVSRCAVRGMER